MKPEEIVHALSHITGIHVLITDHDVSVQVPALQDSVHLRAEEVARARPIFAPDGAPAVEFAVGPAGAERPLIIVGNDVVFAPAGEDSVLDSSIPMRIVNAPGLVAYTEMEREAESAALACERSGPIDLAELGGSFLLLRCFVAGAVRFGLRPARTAAWWQRGWAVMGEDLGLPPFRPDPVWDELTRVPVALTASPAAESDGDPGALTAADFEALAPEVRFGRIDQELVEIWRAWIGATPARFARAILTGIPDARVDVAVYPEGGGGIDLRVGEHALLQLSWPASGDELSIDEIRIDEARRGTGLFQRMLFNSEQLARLLGVGKVTCLATDVGTWAFATIGYPRDPGLR